MYYDSINSRKLCALGTGHESSYHDIGQKDDRYTGLSDGRNSQRSASSQIDVYLVGWSALILL